MRPETAAFNRDLEGSLLALRDELLAGTWRPGGYRSFVVVNPKRRLVSAAPFRDRVVHHAVVGALEPRFERRFIADSFACRKGKGNHSGVGRARGFTRRFRYCLCADVVRFFPSVDHGVLMKAVERVVRCPRTLALLRAILDSGREVLRSEFPGTLFPGDDLTALCRPRGLPIGNLTSQFLANVMLDPLDHFVKETLRVKGYVRYADDFRVFDDSKERLHEVRREMERFLAGLRLVLHDRKTQVVPCAGGVPFLGFVLFPEGRTRLRREGVKRFRKRLRAMAKAFAEGRTTQEAVSASVRSWLAHADHAQAERLKRQMLKEVTFPCRPSGRRSS
ncbi:MAG: RNA-dependent DNA polymerase [Planctomycetaceae bacterium]|nr:RNA-dependent DNA polymerase [Planctomycetaceae bacterium]